MNLKKKKKGSGGICIELQLTTLPFHVNLNENK